MDDDFVLLFGRAVVEAMANAWQTDWRAIGG
jgi:hypothetical protein